MTGAVGFEFEFSVLDKFDRKPERYLKVNWLDKFRDSLFWKRAVSVGLSRASVRLDEANRGDSRMQLLLFSRRSLQSLFMTTVLELSLVPIRGWIHDIGQS